MIERIRVATPSFTTNGLLAYPEEQAARGRIVVNCPHPLLGGTLDNPVVLAMLKGMARAGLVALAWEYRTQGQLLTRKELDNLRCRFWQDNRLEESSPGDLEDAREIDAWLSREDLGCTAPILAWAGYSYGGILALAIAQGKPVFAVSPPLRALSNRVDITEGTRLILAEEDFAVSDEELLDKTNRTRASQQIVTIPGSDHLFLNRLPRIEESAREWAAHSVHSAASSACQTSSLL